MAAGNFINGMKGDMPAREEIDITADPSRPWRACRLDCRDRFRRRLYHRHHAALRHDRGSLRPQGVSHRPADRPRTRYRVYLIFSKLLALSLPAGPLERVFFSESPPDGRLRLSRPGPRGRDPADEPAVRLHRRDARHRRRRAARHRPGADGRAAAACHVQVRSRRLADHVRRHLLRRHVWRLDHRHPDQHAGRKRLARHRAGRQQDGQGRTRRTGAGDRRHRLLRGRHHRHARHRVPRAVAGEASPPASGRRIISR